MEAVVVEAVVVEVVKVDAVEAVNLELGPVLWGRKGWPAD